MIIADPISTYRNLMPSLISQRVNYPGLIIDTAADGDELVNLAREQDYFMIVSANTLQRLDGTEALRQIREFSRAPFYIATASPNPDLIRRVRELGGTDVLSKFGLDMTLPPIILNNILLRATTPRQTK